MRYQVSAVATYGYGLALQTMMGASEGGQQFGPFHSLEAARPFYDAEKVEPYDDEGPDLYEGGKKTYRKNFRKGGPLEWCNPFNDQINWNCPEGSVSPWGHGIHLVLMHVDGVQRLYQLA
jgi:hypothetical protein